MTSDPRRILIRKAAQTVMLRYGFARTSMDDIARESSLSRPALYLVFKNKEEIYRDLVKSIADDCVLATTAALELKHSKPQRLYAMIKASCLDVLEMVFAAPHGVELLDLKSGLAADILIDWREQNLSLLAKAIGGKSARSDATILLDAIDGLKARTSDMAEIRLGVKRVIALVVRESPEH
jgi:AcrR family transcriptional regulator